MIKVTPIEQFKKVHTGNIIDSLFDNVPCAIVSWFTACFSFTNTYFVLGFYEGVNGENYPCDKEGYCNLKNANRCIRLLFKVKKYTYYKRSERFKLKDLKIDGINIICVNGHYISTNYKEYYSFFDNSNDEVIAIWQLDGIDDNVRQDIKMKMR